MVDFANIRKMFDPRKIVEAHFGALGAAFGAPFGMFGQFAQFSPKQYFDQSAYYNPEGYYDAKTILREALK